MKSYSRRDQKFKNVELEMIRATSDLNNEMLNRV